MRSSSVVSNSRRSAGGAGGSGALGGKNPPTLPPPIPPDESEVNAFSQQLFMRVATKRAYPEVEGWFRQQASKMNTNSTDIRDAIDEHEKKLIPKGFTSVSTNREKREAVMTMTRQLVDNVRACGEREERIGNAWLHAFNSAGRAFLENLEKTEEELLRRRREAEQWSLHGERERVMEKMDRFRTKQAALLIRMKEDEAAMNYNQKRELDRLRIAFESCLEEVRDVVAWHVLQQSRGVKGRVSAMHRQKLLSILGEPPPSPSSPRSTGDDVSTDGSEQTNPEDIACVREEHRLRRLLGDTLQQKKQKAATRQRQRDETIRQLKIAMAARQREESLAIQMQLDHVPTPEQVVVPEEQPLPSTRSPFSSSTSSNSNTSKLDGPAAAPAEMTSVSIFASSGALNEAPPLPALMPANCSLPADRSLQALHALAIQESSPSSPGSGHIHHHPGGRGGHYKANHAAGVGTSHGSSGLMHNSASGLSGGRLPQISGKRSSAPRRTASSSQRQPSAASFPSSTVLPPATKASGAKKKLPTTVASPATSSEQQQQQQPIQSSSGSCMTEDGTNSLPDGAETLRPLKLDATRMEVSMGVASPALTEEQQLLQQGSAGEVMPPLEKKVSIQKAMKTPKEGNTSSLGESGRTPDLSAIERSASERTASKVVMRTPREQQQQQQPSPRSSRSAGVGAASSSGKPGGVVAVIGGGSPLHKPSARHPVARINSPREPPVITPPTSGGPGGARIPTEHLNQLLFSLRQEGAETRRTLEQSTRLSSAMLTRLQQLKSTTDLLLLENVRLERDRAALRLEVQQHGIQGQTAAAAAAGASIEEAEQMKNDFDCAMLREEQQDVVEDLQELLVIKQAELKSIQRESEEVAQGVADHDLLLTRVQTYWRSSALELRRACQEGSPLLQRPTKVYHHSPDSQLQVPPSSSNVSSPNGQELPSRTSFSSRGGSEEVSVGDYGDRSSTAESVPNHHHPHNIKNLATARPSEVNWDGVIGMMSGSVGIDGSPGAAAAAALLPHPPSPLQPGISGLVSRDSGGSLRGGRGADDDYDGDAMPSPRELQAYSEGITPIHRLQLYQMDEIAEFLHSVFEAP